MTTIEVSKEKGRSYVGQLMKKLIGNHCCLELLRLFAAHPNGRFSKLALIHAMDENDTRLQIENALKQITIEGIVKTSEEERSTYYTLTQEEAMRKLVINMALFEWHDWQIVLERI